jgi:hypothetical protein
MRRLVLGALLAGCGLSVTSRLAAQTIPLDGLVARWDFEEGSGAIAHDTSGPNANHGTLDNYTDDAQWVAGRFGGGLAFTGATSNRLVVPSHASIAADLANGFTVSAWFRSNVPLASNASTYALLEKGNMFFLLQGVATEGGGMNFLLKKGTVNQTVGIVDALSADTWYHVAGVFTGTEALVYLDGALKGRRAVAAPIDVTDLALVIGGDDLNRVFNGTIDQVLIWNRPLTAEEILQVAARVGAPTVTGQPQAQSVYAGGTATFSVSAAGQNPLRYLWYRNDQPLRTQTAETLVVEYATPADAGLYRVEVSNDIGTAKSQSASLEVRSVEGLQTARVLSMHFNETSGLTASDASGNGNNGQLSGYWDETSHWSAGRVNGSLSFDGVASLVSVPQSQSLSQVQGEATFAFWIHPLGWGVPEDVGVYTRSASYILRKADQFGIRLINDPGTVVQTLVSRAGRGADAGGVVRSAFEVNAPQGSVALDQWQHWVVLYRNNTVSFFRNGFRVGDPVPGTLGPPAEAGLVIGAYDDLATVTSASRLEGRLDELGIWSRPLSEAEILELAGQDVVGVPVIVQQPAGQKRIEGTTAMFEVFVTGKRPLEYQWLKNGIPIAGAVQNTLTLNRLQPADAGGYAVRVTNSEGMTTSEAALLEVEALDAITSGLVAYYTFDDGPGTTLTDSSGNNFHGQLVNMDDASRIAGPIGGAFRFDGSDDYIVVGHDPMLDLTTEATVSVWLKVDGMSPANHDRVIRKGTNFDFVLLPGGVVRTYGIGKAPYDGPAQSWELGIWTHFAYVYRGGTVQWYRNGEPLGALLSGRLGELTADPLVIGNYAAGLTINRPYVGSIDDLGIWQRALSPSDILGIYVNGQQGKPLNQEFRPLTITAIKPAAEAVALEFYTPFNNRPAQIESKAALSDPAWLVVPNLTFVDLGQGLFSASIPVGTAPAGFFRAVALPPPPLFFDDFEQAVPGWTHAGNEDRWERGAPTVGPTAAYSGANVYGTGLNRNVGAYSYCWLQSPEIDLTGVSSATLRFAEWLNLDFLAGVPVEQQAHQVMINVLDASTLATVSDAVYVNAGTSGGWQIRQVRLVGEAVGRKIRLEFLLQTDAFNLLEGWYLDDVTITSN